MVHADGTVLMQAAMFLQQSAPIVPVTCMSGWKAAVMVDAVARKVVAAVLLADVGECHSFDKHMPLPCVTVLLWLFCYRRMLLLRLAAPVPPQLRLLRLF